MTPIHIGIFIILILSYIYVLFLYEQEPIEIHEHPHKDKIKGIVQEVLEEKKKTKKIKDYLDSAHNGMLRGCMVGFITTGTLEAGIISGVVFACVNTVMTHIN